MISTTFKATSPLPQTAKRYRYPCTLHRRGNRYRCGTNAKFQLWSIGLTLEIELRFRYGLAWTAVADLGEGPGGHAPLFWAKKEEIIEEKKASRAGKWRPPPPPPP